MSVKIGGKSFETLDDKIYVGGHKVTKIYAGRKLVYPVREEEPVVERYLFRFWVKWPEPILTTYGPIVIDTIGHYFTVTKDDPPVYRAAIYHDDSDSPPFFKIYFTNVNFSSYGRLIEAIGYAAIHDDIKYDLYNTSFNYFTLIGLSHASTGKIYYTHNTTGRGIRFNATVPGGAYATDAYPVHEWGGTLNGVLVIPFANESAAINYVLGIN